MGFIARSTSIQIRQLIKNLFVHIPADLDGDFAKECFQISAHRIMYQSLVIAGFEAVMIAMSFATVKHDSAIERYRLLYLLLFIAMCASSLIFARYRQHPPRSLWINKLLPALHGTLILQWTVFVTFFDQASYGHTTVYAAGLVGIATVPYIAPVISIVILTLEHLFFIMFLPLYQSNQAILFGHRVNTAIIVIAAWCISRALYYAKYKDFLNINRLKILNETLERLSYIDELTGIPNKRMLNQYLDFEWKRAIDQHSPLSLIFIGIDHFKEYNDSHGHQKGDICLRKVAKAIESTVNASSSLVGRYGGEEFVVVLPGISRGKAIGIASVIQDGVDGLGLEHRFANLTNKVTISLGVSSTIPTANETVQGLLDKADKALYHSKISGRNMITHFEQLA